MESKYYTGAVKHLTTALKSYPRDINALVNLGVALYRRGESEKAMETFLDVIRIKPDHIRALTNMGKIHMAKGAYGSARRSYEKAAGIEPANPAVHLNLGYLAAKRGRYRKAAAHYEQLLKYRPKSAGAHRALAFIYGRHLRLWAKSAFHMRRYMECRPGDPLSRRFKGALKSRDAPPEAPPFRY